MIEHRYGELASQWGELAVPPGDAPFPVAVLLHGGFWKAEYTLDLMRRIATDLRRRGWATWVPEFRRLQPGDRDAIGGEWPGIFEDVAAAVDALADLADEHGLDLDRVAVVGHSSGGHLAGWVAARPGLPEGAPGAAPRVTVRAAVLQAGVLDLERKAKENRDSAKQVAKLLGGKAGDVPDRVALASPQHRVPTGVPTLAVHGSADDTVAAEYSRAFVTAATEAGDPAELALFEGLGHMDHVEPLSPMWIEATRWLDRHR